MVQLVLLYAILELSKPLLAKVLVMIVLKGTIAQDLEMILKQSVQLDHTVQLNLTNQFLAQLVLSVLLLD